MDFYLITLIFVLISLYILSDVQCEPLKKTVIVSPLTARVKVGDTVRFKCHLKEKKNEKFSVVWKHQEEMISERCNAFDTDNYQISCKPNDWSKAYNFTMIINKVAWADRGQWLCLYMLGMASANLTVIQPPVLQPTKIEVVPDKKPSSAASTEVGNPAVIRLPSQVISGAGRSNNPYNLRAGQSIDIHCETKCSYPSVKIFWSRNNISIDPNVNNDGNTIKINNYSHEQKTDKCTTKENKGMFITTSVARVNCVNFQMTGLNKIQCYSESNDDQKQIQARQSVYILCPDVFPTPFTPEYNKGIDGTGGERPMRLTSGEVVGIAVGTAIFLILIFIGCMTLNKKKKHTEQGMIRGMRV